MTSDVQFRRLNFEWNAEPNAPEPRIEVVGDDLLLRFGLNVWVYPSFSEKDVGVLRFSNASHYRLGGTNDEGWWAGQCRYGKMAPAWGEFYELVGGDPMQRVLPDWRATGRLVSGSRHFLFYLRDDTFECLADDWSFSVERC